MACEPVICVGATILFGPCTGFEASTTEETAAGASLVRLIDFATDAGLAGVELLIGILSISISSFTHKKRPAAVTIDERGLARYRCTIRSLG